MPRSDRPVQAKLQCRQSPDPQGAVRKQTRYFALKLPIAVDAKTATFAYLDPGKYTDTELRSGGAAGKCRPAAKRVLSLSRTMGSRGSISYRPKSRNRAMRMRGDSIASGP